MLVGAFYGLALYYINFYGFNAFSPWFMDHRDWMSIVSHCAFGAVLAYAYMRINRRWSAGAIEEVAAVAVQIASPSMPLAIHVRAAEEVQQRRHHSPAPKWDR